MQLDMNTINLTFFFFFKQIIDIILRLLEGHTLNYPNLFYKTNHFHMGGAAFNVHVKPSECASSGI